MSTHCHTSHIAAIHTPVYQSVVTQTSSDKYRTYLTRTAQQKAVSHGNTSASLMERERETQERERGGESERESGRERESQRERAGER